jgi:hypothetical protein
MTSDMPLSEETIASNMQVLRSRISALESELARAREELSWWQTGLRLFGEPAPAEPPMQASFNESANGSKPPLRKAILTLLEENQQSWTTDAVIKELRERAWMPNGQNAQHHVRSMLAQMHRKGEASRVGRGRYRLALPARTDE